MLSLIIYNIYCILSYFKTPHIETNRFPTTSHMTKYAPSSREHQKKKKDTHLKAAGVKQFFFLLLPIFKWYNLCNKKEKKKVRVEIYVARELPIKAGHITNIMLKNMFQLWDYIIYPAGMKKAIIIKKKPVVKLCIIIWLLETVNPNGFCLVLAGDKNIIGNKLI